MENIIDFVSNNYAWFLTITLILLFALIGYIYDSKRNKNDILKRTENELDEEALENLVAPEGKSLAEAVINSKNINPETKSVELVDETILKEEEKVEEDNNITNNN